MKNDTAMVIVPGEVYFFQKGESNPVVEVWPEINGSLSSRTHPYQINKSVEQSVRDWQHFPKKDMKSGMILKVNSGGKEQEIFTIDKAGEKGINISLCEGVKLCRPKPNK